MTLHLPEDWVWDFGLLKMVRIITSFICKHRGRLEIPNCDIGMSESVMLSRKI